MRGGNGWGRSFERVLGVRGCSVWEMTRYKAAYNPEEVLDRQ
jgi:hypothetical protein